jgi:DNA-binding response OmpR family regulator
MPENIQTVNIFSITQDQNDNFLIRDILQRSPDLFDFQIMGDGLEAFVYLNKEGKYRYAETPDIILLSLEVPRLNGYQLLEKIKTNTILAGIPVIVLAENESEKDIVINYNVYADWCICKPINETELLEAIRRFKKGQNQQIYEY